MRTVKIALEAVGIQVTRAVTGAATVMVTGLREAAVGVVVVVTTGAVQAWGAEGVLAPLAWVAAGTVAGMVVQTLGRVTVSVLTSQLVITLDLHVFMLFSDYKEYFL